MIVAYDPAWPSGFEAERIVLERVLAPWLAGGVHHVGSTSVPGLAAKPILDLIVGVSDLEAAEAAFEPLAELGYVPRLHRAEAHAFARPNWEQATHHVHLTEPGSALWRERLAFRDALRASPQLRREYAEWKREHAAKGGYDASKTPFVSRVLATAGIDLAPDEQRLEVGVTPPAS